MDVDWLSILLALDLIYFPLLALWAAWQVMKLRREQSEDEKKHTEHENLEGEVLQLRNEAAEMRQRLVDLDARLEAMQKQFRDRVEVIEAQTHAGSVHIQALKLLERGMGMEELIEAFDLPRGEAELLQALHNAGKKTAG